jgi:hypothetical protein
LSTSGITSSLLSQIFGSDSTANQFVIDLNQLAQDLQSGNLSQAQQDYVTLSQDALNGATSSTATTSASGITTGLLSDIASSPSSLSSFVGDLNQLGTDLQNGNLTSAQGDLLSLDSTALNAASSAGASGTSTSASAASQVSQTETTELIQAIVKALGSGNNSVASSALSALASISPSSAGASALQQESANLGSGATSASLTSQLLQGLNTSSSGNTASILNLLA